MPRLLAAVTVLLVALLLLPLLVTAAVLGAVGRCAPTAAPAVAVAAHSDAARWLTTITAAADRHGVPAGLLAGVIHAESGFDPAAVSPAGAVGIAQLMPATAAALDVDPYDPEAAIDAAARYLRQLRDHPNADSWDDALVGYNAGPARIGQPNASLPAETRAYLPRVRQLADTYGQPPTDHNDSGDGLGIMSSHGQVQPVALAAAAAIRQWGFAGVIGGVGERPDNPTSDHPRGLALDLMIDGSSKTELDRLNRWLIDHRRQLGISYTIWWARSYSDTSGWDTGAHYPKHGGHYDHIHVSFHDTGTGPARMLVGGPTTCAGYGTGEGILYSTGDLAVWAERLASGPYLHRGDSGVSGSPDDGGRIHRQRPRVRGRPRPRARHQPRRRLHRERQPPQAPRLRRDAPRAPRRRVPRHRPGRDAAFYAKVTGDTALAEQVAAFLVAQADEPTMRFATDRSRYCPRTGDHSLFPLSGWLFKHLTAADFVKDRMTPEQWDRIVGWHRGYVDWALPATEARFEQHLPGRRTGTARLAGSLNRLEPAWLGGPVTNVFHRLFNNRIATVYAHYAAVAAATRDPAIADTVVAFAHDWMRYTIYPDGMNAELHRTRDGSRKLGYHINTTGTVGLMGDILTRAFGYDRIFTFTTADGAHGTAGGNKSFHLAVHTAARMMTGDITVRAAGGDNAVLNGHERADETYLAVANRYYQDPFVAAVITRRHPDVPGWHERPVRGWGKGFDGQWSSLLMYGDL